MQGCTDHLTAYVSSYVSGVWSYVTSIVEGKSCEACSIEYVYLATLLPSSAVRKSDVDPKIPRRELDSSCSNKNTLAIRDLHEKELALCSISVWKFSGSLRVSSANPSMFSYSLHRIPSTHLLSPTEPGCFQCFSSFTHAIANIGRSVGSSSWRRGAVQQSRGIYDLSFRSDQTG